MSLINDHCGVVSWVYPNRATIKIRLPGGGSVDNVKNEGFDVGDTVCLITGITGRIEKVMPKYAADLMVEIGNDPILQAALREEEVSNDHITGTTETHEDSPDQRPNAQECPHLYGSEYRGEVEDWGAHPDDADRPYIPPWPESRSRP